MKFNRYVQRTLAWLVFGVYSGIGWFVLFWMLVAERDLYGLLALIIPFFASLLLSLFLYTHPRVSLERQGVRVKWLFRTRFYLWDDICQVGISSFFRTWYYTNRLVLVRTGCSKRGYRDFLFHLRNLGKLIYIPAKPAAVDYVRSCYGPLDFDLTDGGGEQSTVIDE